MAVVTVDMTANDASMFNAWKRSTQSIEAFNNALDKTKGKQAAAKGSGDTLVSSSLKGFASMAMSALSVGAAINFCITAQQNYIKETNEAALKQDKLFKKFATLSGLSGFKDEASRKLITSTSSAFGMKAEAGTMGASALAEEGFDTNMAKGAGLAAILAGVQASGKGAESIAPLVSAAAHSLQRQGIDTGSATKEQLMNTVQEIDAITTGTNLSFEEFDKMASQLNTYGKQGKKSKADREYLKTLGLTPEDIDAEGESDAQAVQNLLKGVSTLPKEQQGAALKRVLGDAYAGGDLTGNVGKFEENKASFRGRVARGTTGTEAETNRLDNELELLKAEKAQKEDQKAKALEIELYKGNKTAAQQFAAKTAASWVGGVTGDADLGNTVGGFIASPFQKRANTQDTVAKAGKSAIELDQFGILQENNRLVKENTDALRGKSSESGKPPVSVTVKISSPPVSRPVPSAALASR